MASELSNGLRKIGIHHRKGCLKKRAAGNSYQIKSFESALTNGVGFLVTKHFTQASFRAIARNGVSKLAGCNKAQPVARAAVGYAEHGHVFRGHPVSVFLNDKELRPGLQANRRAEPQ